MKQKAKMAFFLVALVVSLCGRILLVSGKADMVSFDYHVGGSGQVFYDASFAGTRGGPEFGVFVESRFLSGVITSKTQLTVWNGARSAHQQVAEPFEELSRWQGGATLIGSQKNCTGGLESWWCEWGELTVVLDPE